MASTRSKLDEIVASFSTLEDPRSHINRRHPLPSVLVIAVLAVLAGAAGPTAIARWAMLKEDLLTGILDLPNGIPGKDVFRRVLMLLKPEAFEAAFNAWIARLRDEATAETGVERPIIAIDGKTARRSHDAKNGPRPPARRHRLGRRVRPGPGAGGLCREVQRDHGDPRAARKIDVRGGDGDDRRDGGPEGDRRGGHPRQGRLRPGPEGEPRVAPSGGHRAHRRAAGGGPRSRIALSAATVRTCCRCALACAMYWHRRQPQGRTDCSCASSIPARAAYWWWNSSVSRRRAAFSASCCSRGSNPARVGPNIKAVPGRGAGRSRPKTVTGRRSATNEP